MIWCLLPCLFQFLPYSKPECAPQVSIHWIIFKFPKKLEFSLQELLLLLFLLWGVCSLLFLLHHLLLIFMGSFKGNSQHPCILFCHLRANRCVAHQIQDSCTLMYIEITQLVKKAEPGTQFLVIFNSTRLVSVRFRGWKWGFPGPGSAMWVGSSD